MASLIASPSALSNARARGQRERQSKLIACESVRFNPLHTEFRPLVIGRPMTCTVREKHASVICAAALNARCGAEQTQTVTRESSTITVAPGKEKSPELDDGGTGFPPGDDDGGGGGGGGGGGNWSGGFFLFGFLALLGFLNDQESEGRYGDDRRKMRNY